jgi:hypothetical protein
MAMFPPIFTTCKASSAATALLGIKPFRLYPFGEAPSSPATPYAVWQRFGGSPENNLDSVPDVDSFDLQVDVYGSTESSARETAEALRDAIEPVAHIVAWRGEMKDSTTKLKRFSFDVSWIVQR